jgi:hypothetical protein
MSPLRGWMLTAWVRPFVIEIAAAKVAAWAVTRSRVLASRKGVEGRCGELGAR